MPETTTPPATPEVVPVNPPSPSPTTKSWTDALDALPDIDTPEPPKPSPEPPKPAAEPAKPEPEKAEPEKPEVTEPAKAEVPKPSPQDTMPQFRTNKELREWAKKRDREAVQAEEKRQELERKLAELERVVPKSQEGAELLSQKLAEAQRKLSEHEQLIEMQAFEHSAKYQKEYAEPYYNAREKAYRDISEMMVSEPTGEMDEDGNPVVKKRAATNADFDRIYALPRAQARELAKQLFGEDANDVMLHRRTISELAEKAQAALNDRRQNYAKYKQDELATKNQQQIAIDGLWKTANERISSDPKRAVYWGEDKSDPEANKALAQGFQLADEFFSEKRDQMSPEDRVEFDAYIRHSIAMGPRLAYRLNKANAQIKALTDEIAQLRGSTPGAPAPTAIETPSPPKSIMDRIDAM